MRREQVQSRADHGQHALRQLPGWPGSQGCLRRRQRRSAARALRRAARAVSTGRHSVLGRGLRQAQGAGSVYARESISTLDRRQHAACLPLHGVPRGGLLAWLIAGLPRPARAAHLSNFDCNNEVDSLSPPASHFPRAAQTFAKY